MDIVDLTELITLANSDGDGDCGPSHSCGGGR